MRWLAAVSATVASLIAQDHLHWKAGRSTPGPQSLSPLCASLWWDPDGAGPVGQRLVIGGSLGLSSLGVTSLCWFDPTLGRHGRFPTQPDGVVYAIAELPNGHLLVGGAFTSVGGVNTGLLAEWDGLGWSPFGGGLPGGIGATVNHIEVLPSGAVAIAGQFTVAGSSSPIGFALWDGQQWQLPGGSSLPVTCMAQRPNGTLVVAGTFPGGVAEWNGFAWTTLGLSLPLVGLTDLVVLANGDLVGSYPLGLLRFDGTAWSVLSSSVNLVPRGLVALPNGHLLAGCVTTVNGQATNGLTLWDGLQWQVYAPGVNGITSLTLGPGGEPWVCGNLIATGTTEQLRGVARWDGTRWRSMGLGFDDAVTGILRLPDDSVLALGPFRCVDGLAGGGAAREAGGVWSPLPPAGLIYELFRPRCGVVDGFGVAWIAGATSATGTTYQVKRWNGVAWQAAGGNLAPVSSMAVDGNQVPFLSMPSAIPSVWRWSGTQWVAAGAGPNGPAYALLRRANGDLVAGGEFQIAGSTSVSRIASWNGTSWSPLGAGLNGAVRALAELPDGTLVAAGDFTADGAQQGSLLRVARFDGVAWQPIGTGLDGPAPVSGRALLVLPDGDLLVGGSFDQAGGMLVRNLARWRNGGWCDVDGGLDGVVQSLVQRADGEILAAGLFSEAGGLASDHLARLRTDRPASTNAYGAACAGSAGALSLAARNLPWSGASFRTECQPVAGNAIGVEVLGLGAVQSALSALHPAAVPGCELLAAPDLLSVRTAQGATIASTIAIPRDVALVGRELFQQMLVVEWGAGASIQRIAGSNGLRWRIGAL